MSDFSFTSLAECDRCGKALSSSDDDCPDCSPEDLSRYHFESLLSDDDQIEVVWSVNPTRAWYDLVKQVDDPLKWRCVQSGYCALDMAQLGHNVKEIGEEDDN